MAVLIKLNTIISLAKLVITSTRDGAKTKSVSTITMLSVLTNCSAVSGALNDKLTVGIVTLSAPIRVEIPKKDSRIKICI